MIEAKEAKLLSDARAAEKKATFEKEIDAELPEILGRVEKSIKEAIEEGLSSAWYTPRGANKDQVYSDYELIKPKLEAMGYEVGDLKQYRKHTESGDGIYMTWCAPVRW